MKRIINQIRSLQLRNLLIVFLASTLLLFSTACSQAPRTTSDKTIKEEITAKSDRGYDALDTNQSAKGGMNNYNDDRRYDQPLKSSGKTVNERSEELINQAKRQTQKSQDSLGDYAEEIGSGAAKSVKRAQQEIPQKLGERKDELVNATQDKAANLKKNVERLPEETSKAFQGAMEDRP